MAMTPMPRRYRVTFEANEPCMTDAPQRIRRVAAFARRHGLQVLSIETVDPSRDQNRNRSQSIAARSRS